MGGRQLGVKDVRQVANTLGAPASRSTSAVEAKKRKTPLYLGSATANIGHGEATSGLSGIIKVLLMLREEIIPPEIGTSTRADSTPHGGVVNTGKAINWARASPWCQRRRALVLDQGTIAPTRSALLLEEQPLQNQGHIRSSAADPCELDQDPCARYVIAVSATSKRSLHHNMANLHAWLKKEAKRDRVTLAQISYTTTARRHHHAYRAMFVVSSMGEACTQICSKLQQSREQLKSSSTGFGSTGGFCQLTMTRPVVFAFSSSASSSCSLLRYFRQLYETFSQVRRDVDHFEHVLKLLDLPSVITALRLASSEECEHHRWSETLHPYNSTRSCHTMAPLARVCVQIVIFRLWLSWGIEPVALVTEDDLDVCSALNIAGVLSDADAVYLAGVHILGGQRGRGEDRQSVLEAGLEKSVSVISYRHAQTPVLRLVTAKGGMRSANSRLDVVAARGETNPMFLTRQLLITLKSRHLERISGFASAFPQDLVAACRSSDDIPNQSIIHFMGPEVPMLLEATPDGISEESTCGGGVCTLKSTEGSLSQDRPRIQMWSHLTETLRFFYHEGADVRWNQYLIDLPTSSRRVVSTLPAYSWDLKDYWIPYVNDWTLLKGDSSKSAVAPELESTTIHNIVENNELFEDGVNKMHLIVEADISRHDLHGIVQGHVVDGVPLCTPVCDLSGQKIHGHPAITDNIVTMIVCLF